MKKLRLDQLVYDLGYTESRERAKTTIMSGLVFVNGQRADKPGMQVAPDAKVELHGDALPFVSRGGFKLDKALKVFPIDPAGKTCIDCGASTGGFTDVLLQHGAAKVYAVDVGYGQLAWKLRTDERVVNLERTNLRYVTSEQIPELMDLAVMDVSFISIKLVLPAVKRLLKPDADIVCLIKPQFEAGREEVGKKGVVQRGKYLVAVPLSAGSVAACKIAVAQKALGLVERIEYLASVAELLGADLCVVCKPVGGIGVEPCAALFKLVGVVPMEKRCHGGDAVL